jgi:hypothetical protein
MISDLTWVDFIHQNPNRPQSNALTMMALSPLYGLFFALGLSELWLAATMLGILGQLFWRRVPYSSILVMLPVCGYCLFLQKHFLFPSDDPSFLAGPPSDDDYSWPFFLRNAHDQSIILIGCCWWNNRPGGNRDAPTMVSRK